MKNAAAVPDVETWVETPVEFTTNEVAEILGVSRLNFYEWTARGYVEPVMLSPHRGTAAIFDIRGLMAAAIFNRLRTNVRRPVAGQISSWYQVEGFSIVEDLLYCVIANGEIIYCMGYDPKTTFQAADYTIVIPIRSIRQWIESRLKEIYCHGPIREKEIGSQSCA